MSPKNRLKLYLFIFLLLILAVPAPALAYGDPSGGFLFQVITPLVALLWGAWLAFAHNIHKKMSRIISRWRGVEVPETAEAVEEQPDGTTPQRVAE